MAAEKKPTLIPNEEALRKKLNEMEVSKIKESNSKKNSAHEALILAIDEALKFFVEYEATICDEQNLIKKNFDEIDLSSYDEVDKKFLKRQWNNEIFRYEKLLKNMNTAYQIMKNLLENPSFEEAEKLANLASEIYGHRNGLSTVFGIIFILIRAANSFINTWNSIALFICDLSNASGRFSVIWKLFAGKVCPERSFSRVV